MSGSKILMICKKLTDKTNKDPNSFSVKGKGVGKKTKGKEIKRTQKKKKD